MIKSIALTCLGATEKHRDMLTLLIWFNAIDKHRDLPSPLHLYGVKCVGVSQKGKALSFGLKIVGSSPALLAKEIKLKR